jgi:hypothetical protein
VPLKKIHCVLKYSTSEYKKRTRFQTDNFVERWLWVEKKRMNRKRKKHYELVNLDDSELRAAASQMENGSFSNYQHKKIENSRIC